MVKPGEVKYNVENIGDHETRHLCAVLNEPFMIDQFSHPVAGKGQNIPQNNKPEKAFELKPACSGNMVSVNPVEQIGHSGYKKDMADLMRYQTLCTAMLLHGKSRVNPEEKA